MTTGGAGDLAAPGGAGGAALQDTPATFGAAQLAWPLRPHQERALAAFERDRAAGDRATYLVVPPGGGKTLIGLEVLRRLGRPAVVLCPNTAIQAQWIQQWQAAFAPVTVTATASRELPSPLTVLTYQAVGTFSGNGDGPPGRPGRQPGGRELLAQLHPNGQALIGRLRQGGPWTVVLDECHHLLELWGRLLKTVLEELDDPYVVGLTATPPHLMTTDQAGLHRTLFGQVDLEISTPALVRDGVLAPYQELAYFTRPTPTEADYIHGEAVRFAELRTDLLDPQFASTPFLAWLQTRVVERRGREGAPVSWQRFERDEPALADAAVRLHTAGLLPLPDGAQVREQHRHPPAAEDWVALIGDYCRHCLLPSEDPRDAAAYEAIRRALPAVGYRLTRAGVRAADSPVDRVLARSASKAQAVTDILIAENADLGPRLRALVLCDFEEASGTVPARLTGILEAESGGARLALETLLADEQTAALDPVLMTGQRVACGPDTAAALLAWLRQADPGLGATAAAPAGSSGADVSPAALASGSSTAATPPVRGSRSAVVEITGQAGWEPRRYVPLVTRFFSEGGSRCLVGTRGLLGEGWDAPAVNVVIDLTAATTPTSVVQARGRALRVDRGWPGKVADNWGVICVADDHPKGAADYGRFVRKHDRYFALSATADIVSGVVHVDPSLSPYAPPATDRCGALNAAMLLRPGDRDRVHGNWAVGTPYQDEPVATVTVAARRQLGLAGRAVVPYGRPRRARPWAVAALAVAVTVLVLLSAQPVAASLAASLVVLAGGLTVSRGAVRLGRATGGGCLEDLAAATADGLHAAGLASRDASAVRVESLPDGSYRARLQEVPAGESVTFSTALEEVLSPLAQPRYVVPRLIVQPPHGPAAALGLAARRLVTGRLPATVVYHAVPTVLGVNKERAAAFERAWHDRVSPGPMLFTGSPEGAGILAAQRGDDPFAVTTQIRTLWR
ncbi:MAG: DEAD/DEAH box helicase family protein [Gemmatimonadota bacterium]